MSAAFQMRSHTGYALDDGDRHDVLHLHRHVGLAIPPGTKGGSTGRRTVTEPPPARVASGEHQRAAGADCVAGRRDEVTPSR
jgi:hypothetical protein